ncbi:tetratricopeptide repeat protein [Streptomyces mirabilis]|uniref:tetratricopeptide repeat protein n=1 Tax=Streptomyces mirabilis TaxID=68239 RepID=UPI0036AAD91A
MEEAEAEMRAALEVQTRLLGPEHPNVLQSHTNLGILLRRLERYGEAEAEARIALEGRTRVLGTAHPETAISREILASVLRYQGRNDEADRVVG